MSQPRRPELRGRLLRQTSTCRRAPVRAASPPGRPAAHRAPHRRTPSGFPWRPAAPSPLHPTSARLSPTAPRPSGPDASGGRLGRGSRQAGPRTAPTKAAADAKTTTLPATSCPSSIAPATRGTWSGCRPARAGSRLGVTMTVAIVPYRSVIGCCRSASTRSPTAIANAAPTTATASTPAPMARSSGTLPTATTAPPSPPPRWSRAPLPVRQPIRLPARGFRPPSPPNRSVAAGTRRRSIRVAPASTEVTHGRGRAASPAARARCRRRHRVGRRC